MGYVGVDLHKRQFSVCWIDEDGREKFEKYRMDAEGIKAFKEKLGKDVEVGIEATGNSKYFRDEIVDVVKSVKVVNPVQFKLISRSVKKTDCSASGGIGVLNMV